MYNTYLCYSRERESGRGGGEIQIYSGKKMAKTTCRLQSISDRGLSWITDNCCSCIRAWREYFGFVTALSLWMDCRSRSAVWR